MRKKIGLLALLLMLAAVWLSGQVALAADTELDAAAKYIYETVASPTVGSIGGEWAVLGLARSGYDVPAAYYQKYYSAVESYVKQCKGVLHERKYTEYARVIVALSAMGKDARQVAGYDLTKPLGDYDKTVWQGNSGPAWALIALDSRNYPMPVCPTAAKPATRQLYVDRLISTQNTDGGWSIGATGSSDIDMTAMVLQALAKYQQQSAVAAATKKGLTYLSNQQNASGGYASSESTAQVLVALCELGLHVTDSRFVKNGHSLPDDLASYRSGGGYCHTKGEAVNQMASEQALYALAAMKRAQGGQNSLYRMSDATDLTAASPSAPQTFIVVRQPITRPGMTFSDIVGIPDQAAIEALAERAIINGMGDDSFAPNKTMTRAEFATIVVKALGLIPEKTTNFKDVPAGSWYAGFVGTAYRAGIVYGLTDTVFAPTGTITRQEAACMVVRAARLCGQNTAVTAAQEQEALAIFSDAASIASWARDDLAYCCRAGLLDAAGEMKPARPILRCEIAQIVYRLLDSSHLL